MRLSIALIIFLLYHNTVRSQDLIVTEKEDSLNCKITQIKSGFIHFTFKYENEIRNTLLTTGQIKFYKKDFFSIAEVPVNNVKMIGGTYQKLRIGIYGGWSYLTAKLSSDVPDELQQYVKDLKSGYHVGGDLIYFTSEKVGFGIKYSMFRSENELNNIHVLYNGTGWSQKGTIKDDITIQYFGPTIGTRISSENKKTHFITNFSVGYLLYENNATVIESFTLTSETLGLMWDLGVDFPLAENLSLGLFFAYKIGTLNELKYTDAKQIKTIELENLESISRIDLSIGLRWNK